MFSFSFTWGFPCVSLQFLVLPLRAQWIILWPAELLYTYTDLASLKAPKIEIDSNSQPFLIFLSFLQWISLSWLKYSWNLLVFFSLPLACVQEREIDCSCILFFTSKSLSLTAVPFNMAHLACKSPFLSSSWFTRSSQSLFSSPQQSVWELIKSVCVSVKGRSACLVALAEGLCSHLNPPPPACHNSSKEKWVLGCHTICVCGYFFCLEANTPGEARQQCCLRW